MTAILVGWVNDVLALDALMTEASLDDDVSSGFVLGALLHRYNQLPAYRELRRRDTSDAKICNFCLLEPALTKLGVAFDVNMAHRVMLAQPGAGALVLYQLKVALDKLQKTSAPVSLRARKDGVRPLVNLAAKAPKPQFDSAKARLFEAAIRARAENPNALLERRHLERFENEFQEGRQKNARGQQEARADLMRQQLESRDLRLYARQQEAAFLASWDSRGQEQWQANRQKAKDREAHEERHDSRAALKRSAKVEAARSRAACTTTRQFDDFERRLAEREASRSAQPRLAPAQPRFDRDDPLCESSRCVSSTVALSAGLAAADVDDSALDKVALREEVWVQDSVRRVAAAEREGRSRHREMRRRRFITERESAQVVEYHDRAASHLSAQLTRKCASESDVSSHLERISRHAHRMASSRRFRASQYAARRDVDADHALKVDAAALEAEIGVYEAQVQESHDVLFCASEARSAAKRAEAEAECASILRRVADLAVEVSRAREFERPCVQHQGQAFLARKSAPPECETDSLRAWYDAKRLFLTRDVALLTSSSQAASVTCAWAASTAAASDGAAAWTPADSTPGAAASDGAAASASSTAAAADGAASTSLDEASAASPKTVRPNPPAPAAQSPARRSAAANQAFDAVALHAPAQNQAFDESGHGEAQSGLSDDLDALDLSDYVSNAPPFWFSGALAKTGLVALADAETVAAAMAESQLEADKTLQENVSAPASGEPHALHCSLGDDASRGLAARAEEAYGRAASLPGNFVEHLLGECVVEVRLAARLASDAPAEAERPRMFPLRLALCGPSFSGKSEQAARIADRFRVKVLSVEALVHDALAMHEHVRSGRRAPTACASGVLLLKLGRAVSDSLRGGGAVSDSQYAQLVCCGIHRLAEENDGLHDTSIAENAEDSEADAVKREPWQGFVLDDFPNTAEQAAALELELTGYVGEKVAPSRWDCVSILAPARPKPLPRWPGLAPGGGGFVESGLDMILCIQSTSSDSLKRALGRRVDAAQPPTPRDGAEEWHLEFHRPPYDAPRKADLVRVLDPANPVALLPHQLVVFETEAAALALYLKRFGTVRNVQAQGLTQEATFAHVAHLVDAVVQRRVDEAQKGAEDEASARVRAFENALAALQSKQAGLAADCAACAALVFLLQLPPEEAKKAKKRASRELEEEAPLEARQAGAAAAAAAASAASAALDAEVIRMRRLGPHTFQLQDAQVDAALRDAAIAAKLEARPLILPNALARGLAESWAAAEDLFVRGAKRALRGLRQERWRSAREVHTLRVDFGAFLARPDGGGEVLALFLDGFNQMPQRMRHDDNVKAELHLRCDEVRCALWGAGEARRAEAASLLRDVRADGSLQRRQLATARNLAALVQLEVDRCHAALSLLHDYFDAACPADATPVSADGAGPLKKWPQEGSAKTEPKQPDAKRPSSKTDLLAADRSPFPPEVMAGLDSAECDQLEAASLRDSAIMQTAPTAKVPPKAKAPGKAVKEEIVDGGPLAAALKGALDFASSWAMPPHVVQGGANALAQQPAQPWPLREAAWHEAARLTARLRRLEACASAAWAGEAARCEEVFAEMEEWLVQRAEAELAVVEKVSQVLFQCVEAATPMQDALELDGITLAINPHVRLVPLRDCAEWTSHSRAHALLMHVNLAQRLPLEPPPPNVSHLPTDHFSKDQAAQLEAALHGAANIFAAPNSVASFPGAAKASPLDTLAAAPPVACEVPVATAVEVLRRLQLYRAALPESWQSLPRPDVAHWVQRLDPTESGAVSVANVLAALPRAAH
ncbi:hypothetical protein M885DRAFT_508756 [Pelagophyceae sp. CCMP2097]|nr:hypothetical protein M885DRAFT_508756 [Pelagophyceae sp. CCMP2097]